MSAKETFSARGAWRQRVLRNPLSSIGLAILCLVGDYFIGPRIIFPVSFLLPVILSAWFCRPYYAYSLAIILPLIRLGFGFEWNFPSGVAIAITNTAIRITVFSLFAYFVSRTSRQARELAARVNLLEGILPICSLCKKIRDERGNWHPVEVYVSNRSEALFSHSLCPECMNRDYKSVPADV